jgi:hypothetical protein
VGGVEYLACQAGREAERIEVVLHGRGYLVMCEWDTWRGKRVLDGDRGR